MSFRRFALIAAAATLCACASAPRTSWQPRADADLDADLATCQAEANGIDILGSPSTNSAYNTAAAVAYHYERQNGRRGATRRMYDAVRDSCMVRKGWTRAE